MSFRIHPAWFGVAALFLTVACAAATPALQPTSPPANTLPTSPPVVEEPSAVPAQPTTTPPTVGAVPTTCDPQALAASAGASQIRTLPNGRAFPGRGVGRTEPPGPPPRNQVLIQFTPDSSQQARNDYIQQINGRSRRRVDSLDVYAVTLPGNQSPETLPPSPIVVFTEPDYIAGATVQQGDPRYGEQWALPAMRFPQRWNTMPTNAAAVTVAVIDSGICAAHPDLAGQVVNGFDFVDGDTAPQDELGHGCAVAGIVAAVAGNGQGMTGAAPNARVMPLRVLDRNGLGDYSAISEAIVYAADNGADVINLSLAGGFNSQVMAEAVAYAQARGITVVAAAGNAGVSTPAYPASYPGVISVGAIDPNLERSSFSNFGSTVTTYAPGRDILGTSTNGDYDFFTGTSFAAPLVAGLVAVSRATGEPIPQGVLAENTAVGGC